MRRAELLEHLRAHAFVVQASVSPDGVAQAAVIGIAVTDSLEIVFDSVDTTRKIRNLLMNPQIAFVIGGWMPGDERTIQYEGVADTPHGSELERLKTIYYARFPDGQQKVNWPGLIYVRVRPMWIRYSDFNQSPASIVELDAEHIGALK